MPEDATDLPEDEVLVRNRSNTNTEIFRAPHILITKGFQRIAYADFDVSFRHAVRGIHGPPEDRSLLIFLAAYLRTSLAKYLMFHTSSNWGIYRPEVHVQEIVRLPMVLPGDHEDPAAARVIVEQVVEIIDDAIGTGSTNYLLRDNAVVAATQAIEPLVDAYFGVQPSERLLIDDAIYVIIPSVQPTRSRIAVPTMTPAADEVLAAYRERLCATLGQWSRTSDPVEGRVARSRKLGLAMVVIERTTAPRPRLADAAIDDLDVLTTIDRLPKGFPRHETHSRFRTRTDGFRRSQSLHRQARCMPLLDAIGGPERC